MERVSLFFVTEYLSQLIVSVNFNIRLDILMKIYYWIIPNIRNLLLNYSEYSAAAEYSVAAEYSAPAEYSE